MKSSGKPAKKPKPEEISSPKLLSGGNPQIPKGDGDAAVQSYIAAMPGWKAAVGTRLDRLIVETVPSVRKAVRWNTPFYGLEDRGWFLAYHCFNKYVKISFFAGAELSPAPPIAAKQPNVRYHHIHEGEEIDTDLLKSWIRQAAALPGERLF